MKWPWRRRNDCAAEILRLRNRVAFLENELRQAVEANVDVSNAYTQQARVLRVYRAQLAARDAAAVRRRERGA